MHSDQGASQSVVVVAHGDWTSTRRCLTAIAALDHDLPLETVVVYDARAGSPPPELPSIPGLLLKRLDAGSEAARAMNSGAALATGDVVVFLDRRREVGTRWPSIIRAAFGAPNITAALPGSSSGAGGAWLAVRATVFRAMGGFDAAEPNPSEAFLTRLLRGEARIELVGDAGVLAAGSAPAVPPGPRAAGGTARALDGASEQPPPLSTPRAPPARAPAEAIQGLLSRRLTALTELRDAAHHLSTSFPGDRDARFLLAELYQAAGMEAQALEEYERLREDCPENERLRVEQGITQCQADHAYFPSEFASRFSNGEYVTGHNAKVWRQYAWREIKRAREIVRTIRQVTPLRGKRVLDVGSGYGGMLIAMAEQGAEAVGVEIDPERAHTSKARLADLGMRVPVYEADICEPATCERLGGTFDVVVCQDVLEHVLQPATVIDGLGAMMSPGGVVYIQIPNHLGIDQLASDHHYGLAGLTALSRAQSISYWCAATGMKPEHYTVGYERNERFYARAFARSGVRLHPVDRFATVAHVQWYGDRAAALGEMLATPLHPALAPELDRRVRSRIALVIRTYQRALEALLSSPARDERHAELADRVVRRLCLGLWRYIGVKDAQPRPHDPEPPRRRPSVPASAPTPAPTQRAARPVPGAVARAATGAGPGGEAPQAEALLSHASRRILIVHECLPKHDRSGSDARLMQVVRRLLAQGHAVTYVARDGSGWETYQRDLEQLGVEVFAHDAAHLAPNGVAAPAAWKFDEVLARGRFDLALIFHWFWSGLSAMEVYFEDIRRLSPSTRVVVMTDDRHGLREARAAELSRATRDLERGRDFTARELECYRVADLVTAITEDDRRGLLELAPELEIELLPMTTEVAPERAPFDARDGYVFLGNFDNLANRDAIEWLVREIWPAIRARHPGAVLHVAGNNVPPELAGVPGAVLDGHVPELAAGLSPRRVFLSPIRFGTGIKTKNVASMAHGLPMVTTTVGAEGMDLVHGQQAFLADDAERFAEAAVALHGDAALWERISRAGQAHVETVFSVRRLDEQLRRVVDRACSRPARTLPDGHCFSARRVDGQLAAALGGPIIPALARVKGYVALAERLASEERFRDAVEQARHVFPYLRGAPRPELLFWRAYSVLARCYEAAGDRRDAERCRREAEACLPTVPSVIRGGKKPRRSAGVELSLIIPTHDRRATLERCLEALERQTLERGRFEVVVVDDGSRDDTPALLESWHGRLPLVALRQENRGVGAARRAAVAAASGDYLLLANDDTLAEGDLLEQHLRAQAWASRAGLALLGEFAYRDPSRRPLLHVLSSTSLLFPQVAMDPDALYGPSQAATCNLSIRRDLVVRAGSFDPQFWVAEDTDLGLRLMQLGVRVARLREARAWHDHSDIQVRDFVARGRRYGAAWLALFAKYPGLALEEFGVKVTAPIGEATIARVRSALAPFRDMIERSVVRMEELDSCDLPRLVSTDPSAAEDLVRNLVSGLRQVHWFHVLDGLCDTYEQSARYGERRIEAS